MKKIALILLTMFTGVCYAFDNKPAQFPTAQMQSVNNYHMSTNYSPQITPVGSTTVYGAPSLSKPRRNTEIGHGEEGDPNIPYPTPVGDIPWILISSLVILYVLLLNKKERVED